MLHFEHWSPPPLTENEIRLHFDTREARGFIPEFVPAAAIDYRDEAFENFIDEGDANIVRLLRRRYVGGFLYADSVVEADPLSIWAHMSYGGIDTFAAAVHLTQIIHGLKRLRPILDSGHLILAPIPTPEETDIDADAAEMDAARIGKSVSRADAPTLMWLRLALRLCAKSQASLSPWNDFRWRCLSEIVSTSREDLETQGIDLRSPTLYQRSNFQSSPMCPYKLYSKSGRTKRRSRSGEVNYEWQVDSSAPLQISSPLQRRLRTSFGM